ncbi:bacterial regulatory helix-turn-helix, lysR family protein, partial [Vibrio parahaemolyticus 10296]
TRPNLMYASLTFLDGSIWNKKALMLRWCMATLKSGKTTIAKSSVKTNWY